MKDKSIKKIIEKSEVKTSADFTNTLMAEIEKEASLQEPVKFWTTNQILLGFALITIVSGYLVYKLSNYIFSENSTIIPLLWAFILLLGLSYVLGINDYKKLLKSNL